MDQKREVIGVIGAGTMGSGIAQVAAKAGHIVLLHDSKTGAFAKASEERKKSLARLVEKGKMSGDEAERISSSIKEAKSVKDLADSGLVIEAIVEDLEIKQKIFREIESAVSSEAIIASNTSSLSITSIASSCKKPERILGLHFFNPAPLMPLVEVIGGLGTSMEKIKASKSLVDSWGKKTVIAKDTPGFIVNRIARPYYSEAIRIYEEQWQGLPAGEKGIATIDWAMKEFGGFKMGPFELMDLIGNDVNYAVTETVWKQYFFDPRYKPSITQKRLFEAGRLGKKSGHGYYNYSGNGHMPEPEKNVEMGLHIFSRILAMLINEAADALYYNIASRDDIDHAMTNGVNYPKGLLQWCDEAGAENILNIISALRKLYEEERYRPSVLLKQMASEKKKFYN